MIKQTEQNSNLMLKELSRDLLSQSVKRFILKNWENMPEHIIQFIFKQLIDELDQLVLSYTSDPVKNFEAVRLIEYPYSILQFVVKEFSRRPTRFGDFIL
jgi:hypothetical protein